MFSLFSRYQSSLLKMAETENKTLQKGITFVFHFESIIIIKFLPISRKECDQHVSKILLVIFIYLDICK